MKRMIRSKPANISEKQHDPEKKFEAALVWCREHHFERLETGVACDCPPGPQILASNLETDEMLLGGPRGGGKTLVGMDLLLRGNRHLPRQHTPEQHDNAVKKTGICGWCVNETYIKHPSYQALVLRENEKDLAEWVNDARNYFSRFNAEVTERPALIKFPNPYQYKRWGARFYVGHLKDESSYTSYIGRNLHTLLIEELTLIPGEARFVSLFGSMRSKHHCYRRCGRGKCTCGVLVPRKYATANPGGAGHRFVANRYVFPADRDPKNTFYFFWGKMSGFQIVQSHLVPSVPADCKELKMPDGQSRGHIYRDPRTGTTRAYIASSYRDNPYIDQEQYEKELNELEFVDPAKWRAWKFGDWKAFAGQYFHWFRPHGPLSGEENFWPAELRAFGHVIPPQKLDYWLPRTIGIDWGYNHESAVYWTCKNEADSRIHTYREFVTKDMGCDELGANVARLSVNDLEGCGHINLHLSHDCFSKTDDRLTKAEQFKAGLEQVLGSGAAFLMAFDKDEQELRDRDPARAAERLIARRKSASESRITIHRSTRDREGGWQYIRQLLRFRPTAELPSPDMEFARKLLGQPDGVRKYNDYIRDFEKAKEAEPPLPGMLIHDCCPKLAQQITEAIHEEGTEDILEDGKAHSNDRLDAWRYNLMGRRDVESKLPKEVFTARRVEKYAPANFNDLVYVVKKAHHDYDEEQAGTEPINIGRYGSRRGRWGDGEVDAA